jgi:hypothetical protein
MESNHRWAMKIVNFLKSFFVSRKRLSKMYKKSMQDKQMIDEYKRDRTKKLKCASKRKLINCLIKLELILINQGVKK